MAPDTMVVAVVANDSWKRKAALMGPIRGSLTVGSTKKFPHPINGVVHGPFPKLRANPNIQYVSPPNTTSATFFIMMFTSFLMDTHPDSSMPKPANVRVSAGVFATPALVCFGVKWNSVE